MSKLTKTLLVMTLAGVVAAPAFAQNIERIVEPVPTAEADFKISDLDQDGALNRDEFVTFAVMRKESGDAAFTEIVRAGDYDAKFAAHDHDADGAISAEELGHADDTKDKIDPVAEPELEDIKPEME